MNRFFDRYKAVIIWIMVIGFFLGGVGLVAFRYFGPSSSSSDGDKIKDVVLTVNGDEVYRTEYKDVYDNIVSRQQSLYSRFGQDFSKLLEGTSGKLYELRLKSQTVNTLIEQQIIHQESEKRDIEPGKTKVEQAYNDQINSILEQQDWTLDQLKNVLASQGRNYEEFEKTAKTSIREQLKRKQLKEQVIGEIDPTNNELRTYFDDNIDNYVQTPAKVNASHLVFDTQAKARAVLQEVQSNASVFTEYAKEAEESVDMGWFGRGQKSKSIDELAFSLKVDEFGGPIQTTDGWEILRVDDKQERTVPSFQSIKDQIREDYVSEQESKKYDKWYNDVKSKSSIEITLPLVEAYREQQKGFEQGLEAYRQLMEEDPNEYPYLPYYIGRLYEQEIGNLQEQISKVENEEKRKELETKISEYKEKAVTNYLKVVRTTGSNDLDLLNRVLQLNSTSPEANYYRGQALLKQKQYSQALNSFKQAIKSKDDYVAAYIEYGDVLVTLRNYDKAIEQYKHVLELTGNNVSVLNKLANTYQKSGQLEKAEETYKKALEINPGNFDTKKGLGDLYKQQKNYGQAIKYYNDALAVKADSETGVSLGWTYLEDGQLDEAKSEFNNVLASDPYNSEAYLGLGDVYSEKGLEEMALEKYRDGLARTQDNQLIIELGKSIVELQKQQASIETRFTLATAYEEEHIYNAAIDQYEKILDYSQDSAEEREAYRGLGDSYVEKTDYTKAERYYKKGLELSESDVQKLPFYKGLLQADEGEHGKDSLSSVGKETLLKMGQINIDQGNPSKAKERLQRLSDLDPNFQTEKVEGLLNRVESSGTEQ